MTAERVGLNIVGMDVSHAEDVVPGEFTPVEAPQDTDLARLKGKMAAARARVQAKSYRIPVPSMEDTFVVEYGAIDSRTVTAIGKKVADAKGTQTDLEVQGLVAHCHGVYLITDAGEHVSAALDDPGPAPGFDARLAEAFGEQFVTADLLLRGFYGTDGAIHSVWEALWDLSGYGHGLELAEATRGN